MSRVALVACVRGVSRVPCLAGLFVSLLFAAPLQAQPFAGGKSEATLDVLQSKITVYVYKPSCANPSLLLVFHGQNHNARDYRDWALPLGDKHCYLVVAPLFDKERFPRWRYQHGGVVKNGTIQPGAEWTARYVRELALQAGRREGRDLPYRLIGHSAGGQFLARLAAFSPSEARRIVLANPGTHVLPDTSVKAPYGFAGAFAPGQLDTELRRYLNAPVTIFLGEDDTDDDGLNASPEARSQGATRLERGHNAYEKARALAHSRGWNFNWRLVQVPGIGHRARKMFVTPEASQALSD